jgi:hypothetical protein
MRRAPCEQLQGRKPHYRLPEPQRKTLHHGKPDTNTGKRTGTYRCGKDVEVTRPHFGSPTQLKNGGRDIFQVSAIGLKDYFFNGFPVRCSRDA